MVSGEYPPAKGGIGRYTRNLVHALGKHAEVMVTCNKSTLINQDNVFPVIVRGDYNNSNAILKIIKETGPDVVHAQYDRELYENDTNVSYLIKRSLRGSTLDKFYHINTVPTVSTLHSIYPYDEYLAYINDIRRSKEGRLEFLPMPLRAVVIKQYLQKRYKLLMSVTKASDEIVNLSNSMYSLVGRGKVIYHGAEPSFIPNVSKEELRKELGLPTDKRLLLAFGFAALYRGLDILSKIKLPNGWNIVVKQIQNERGVDRPIDIPKVLRLNSEYMDEHNFSKLFFACDAMIFPYRIISISGVLFDALAHGLPFVSSNLNFFREFADLGLGVVAERDPDSLSNAIDMLASDYDRLRRNVENFRHNLKWDVVAEKHIKLYHELISKETKSVART